MNIHPLRSLNARLLLAILASIVVALAVGGAMIHEQFEKRLLEDLDRALLIDLDFFASNCFQDAENGKGFVMLGYLEAFMFRRESDNRAFAHFRYAEDQRLLAYTNNLRENPLPPDRHGLPEAGLR